MKLPKNETVSIRTSAAIKQLLRIAAEREHRSIASMVEVLVLSYAKEHGLQADAQTKDVTNKKKGSDGTH